MARARLHLDQFAPPRWKRSAVWQTGMIGLAALTLLTAFVLRVAPGARAPSAKHEGGAPSASLRPIVRAEPPLNELDLIAARNLFNRSRTDWSGVGAPVAEAPRDTGASRLAQLKAMNEALDKLVFMATMRVGDRWRALFDSPERAPYDDLVALGVGDEYKGWTLVAITRDNAVFGFESVQRAVSLDPKVRRAGAAGGRPQQPPQRGRSQIEVREPSARGGVADEPPISLEEAARRVSEAVGEDEKLRQLANELLKSLDDDDA